MTSTSTAITCAESSYTSPKGLQFSLYCNQDQTNIGDIGSVGADTDEDCLNQCSTHPAQACGAAAFDSTARKCYFKDTNVTAVDAVTRDGWILGIANKTQYQPLPLACTNNGGNQTAQNGLNFTIYCDQTAVGWDACPDDSPDCRSHTSSLDECLDSCSIMHPLCTGVAWDTSLKYGYLNCYPKNATARTIDNIRSSNTDGVRVAKALLEVAATTGYCGVSNNGTIVASNKDSFELSCVQDRPGNNITVQHADSLVHCIDSCANYTEANCFGAVYDTTMLNGYENCYLKSAIGDPTNRNGFTFALRSNASSSSTSGSSTPSSQQKHQSSKAWIAGPVIGAVVAMAIIAAALWCWRKRRGQKETQATPIVSPQEAWLMKPELDSTTHNTPKHELDSSQHIAELDSTTKGSNYR